MRPLGLEDVLGLEYVLRTRLHKPRQAWYLGPKISPSEERPIPQIPLRADKGPYHWPIGAPFPKSTSIIIVHT